MKKTEPLKFVRIDPATVDVTVRRWQDATGKEAVNASKPSERFNARATKAKAR